MKKNIILLALTLSTLSCSKDFLESAPTETISNPPAQAKLNGLYAMMIKTGTGGIEGDDDFGQKGYDIFSDMLSSDMVLGSVTYGWYSSIANLTATQDYTNSRNYMPWRYYYRVIYAANDVITGLGGSNAAPEKEDDRYALGQAKAMRAYAYFYLLQFYTNKYEPSSSTNSIPLYLDAGVKAAANATQEDIYNQIIKDLTDAVRDLDGYLRPNKGSINKYVAEGLLAYAYAAMGKDAEAANSALDIINSNNFPITSREETVYMEHSPGVKSGGGFNNIDTRSWMWGYDIKISNELDLVSWWGQVDIFTYSYAWAGDPKVIDVSLYNSIKNNDIRKNQFKTTDGYTYAPYNKFFAPERKIGGQRKIEADYIFMRVDEFHLLAAESLAKSGDLLQAKKIYKDFLKNRFPATSADADVAYIDSLSKDKLLEDIYLNTRIELWGEGKTYLALKRNKKSVTRGKNHLFFAGESFEYDNPKLTFRIPQEEITNNPNL